MFGVWTNETSWGLGKHNRHFSQFYDNIELRLVGGRRILPGHVRVSTMCDKDLEFDRLPQTLFLTLFK